jgi:hypothetical protein
MAARIEVTQGPDEGLQVVFGAAEVRVGRGAGCTLALTDDAMAGQLRVGMERGTYVVKNEMESPGWFLSAEGSPGDPEAFHPGQKRVWYHSSRIQPTARTVLALYIDEGLTAPESGAEVRRGKPTAAAKKAKDRVTIAIIVVLFAVAAMLFFVETEEQPQVRSPAEVRAAFARVEERLRDVREGPRLGRAAEVLLAHLREARFQELAGYPSRALEEYFVARDELNGVLGPPDAAPASMSPTTAEAFGKAREFVNGRLVELSSSQGKVGGPR